MSIETGKIRICGLLTHPSPTLTILYKDHVFASQAAMGRGGCCGFIATIFFCALMAALHDVGIILFKTPLAATQHTWAGTRKILCTTVSLPSIDDKAREKIVFNILRQWDKELAICKEVRV